MKKILLLCLSSLAVASAAAFDGVKTFTGAYVQCASPNGQYFVGDQSGTLTIYDRSKDAPVILNYDDDHEYITGLGNCVSNTGIVLCNQNPTVEKPTYWYNGEWFEVSAPEGGYFGAQLHGITPDGKRIVGCVDASGLPDVANLAMQLPAYWDVNEDGSYGEYNLLPCPDKDFTGHDPQYITATYVSENGKVVAGQIINYNGMYIQPIVYTQDENGDWSYNLPLADIFDISKCPELPDEPEMPTAKSMLTDEQNAQYKTDYDAWKAAGGSSADKPKYEDYLTDEQKAELQAAMEVYDEEYATWEEAMTEYNAFWESLPKFAMNDIRMSPDGSVITTTAQIMAGRWSFSFIPYAINLTTNEVSQLTFEGNNEPLVVTQIIDANTFLAFNSLQSETPKGFVIKDGELTDIYDFICAASPAAKEWAEETLLHHTEIWDEETEDLVPVDISYSGMVVASQDLSVVSICTNSRYWGDGYTQYLYVVDLNATDGVSDVVVRDTKIGFDASGNLSLSEDIAGAQVYDLSGRLVVAEGDSTSKLASGLYIVRARRVDGSAVAAKVRK